MDSGSRTAFQLGPYNCVERLRAGPLGVEFRAKQYRLGGIEEQFAVTRLHPHLEKDDRFVARLAASVRVQAQLEHETLGKTLALESAGSERFLVAEFIHGLDQRQIRAGLIARGDALPPDVAAVMISDVARAVAYAHGRTDLLADGVIHAGLSPSTVMVTAEGAVKVTGVGLARAFMPGSFTADPALAEYLLFQPPESLHGEPPQQSSDVWALGALLWELATGAPPFPPGSIEQIERAFVAGPVAPERGESKLTTIARRCLRASAVDRPGTVGEIGAELDRWLGARREAAVGARIDMARRLVTRPRSTGMFLVPTAAALAAAKEERPERLDTKLGWSPPTPVAPRGRPAPIREDSWLEIETVIEFEAEAEAEIAIDQASEAEAENPVDEVTVVELEVRVDADAEDFDRGDPLTPLTPRPRPVPELPPPAAPSLLPTLPPTGAYDLDRLAALESRTPPALPTSPVLIDPMAEAPLPSLSPTGVFSDAHPKRAAPEPDFTLPPLPPPPAAIAAPRRPTTQSLPPIRRSRRGFVVAVISGVVVMAAAIGLFKWAVGDDPSSPPSDRTPPVAAPLLSVTPKPETPPPSLSPKPEAPLPAVSPKPEAPLPSVTPKPETPLPSVTPKPEAAVNADPPVASGSLALSSEPAGAAIFVDGAPSGVTPARLPLGAGRHRVLIAAPGHALWKRDIDLTHDAGAVAATLEPLHAALGHGAGVKVRCKSAGQARVLIDGVDTGVLCPNDRRIDVAPGPHKVGLFLFKSGRTVERDVDLDESESSTRVYFTD